METLRSVRLAVMAGLLVAGGLLLPAPTDAARAPCEASPGTSGIEQYCESPPGAGGDRPAGGGSGGAVDRRTAGELRAAGVDGVGVLSLPHEGAARSGGDRTSKKPDQPSDDPVGAAGSAVDSGSSASPTFLLILGGVAVAMGALAWARSRRGAKD